MFLQICIAAAGIYYGRRFLGKLRAVEEPPPHDVPEPERQDLVATTLRAEQARARTDAQFRFSLICVGVTGVASFLVPPLRVLGGVLVIVGGIPIMQRAKQQLLEEHRSSAELLDTVALTTTVATGHYVSSAIVFFIYAGGQKLRQMTERAAQESLVDAFGRRSDLVWVMRGGVEVSIPLASLQVGDIAVVDAGSPIPADGIVIEGAGSVDQHILTGESQPLERNVGDSVFAATMVCWGRLHVEVQTTGEATVAAEIAGMIATTTAYTSTLEAEGQRIADRLAVPTLALSGAAYPLVGSVGSVALLNSSFLDNMRLFIPLSMLNYLRQASEAGILIKDGRSFQVLPQVDTVIFDKTGTLTLNELSVSKVLPVCGIEGDDLLRLAAAAEHRQTHPIARAIVRAARERGLVVPAVQETQVELGYGLTAKLGEHEVRVGSRRYINVRDTAVWEDEDEPFEMTSRVYVALGSTLLGALELKPTVHPQVESILADLRARDLDLYLVSGDQERPTRALASALGIDKHFAGVLPVDKAKLIDELQADGRTVCFIGDGINDCIALTRAAVSVTIAGASAPAVHSAQVVLDDLALLPSVFETADQFRQNVDRIKVSLGAPAVIGIGGVLLAGLSVPAMTSLYAVSMLSSMSIAMWPHRYRGMRPRLHTPLLPRTATPSMSLA